MSDAIAILNPGSEALSKFASPAEYNDSRVSSPCPSLVNSVTTTTDPESEVDDDMVTAFPAYAGRLPINPETKHQDGTVYSAGGPDESHQRQGPHDSHSMKSDLSDDGRACNQGNNCGHEYNGGGKLRGDGDGGPDGPGPQSPGRRIMGGGPVKDSRRWACPYRKRNPLQFNIRDHMTCSHLPFDNLSILKEHLKHKHAPRVDHEEQCPSKSGGVNTCTCTSIKTADNAEGHMSSDVMNKINDTRVGRTPQQKTWEAIYQMLFGNLESVPKADWEAPIELEEYFVEIRQNLGVLRERVKLEAQKLIPDYHDTQVNVWSSMTHIFIFFLEQTMSSCQQRVRGNADMSLFGPNCSWSKPLPVTDNTPHDLLGLGEWSKAFHDKPPNSQRTVHRDICVPSSLLLAVKSGEKEFFCRVDCTKQQLWAILGTDQPLAGRADAEIHKEQETSMEVDEDKEMTPACSPMDMSGLSVSLVSPDQSACQSDVDEDAESAASDDEDAIADEIISRVCDIVLRYCGGPATGSADLDIISQAVGTAVTDFVHELLNELSTFPQTNQCGGDGGPTPTFNPGSGDGGYGESSGAAGGAGLGGQGIPNSGESSQGVGGNGPLRPGKGGALPNGKYLFHGHLWGCPFRKHNPERFSISDKRYKQCATTGWAKFEHLKRHLREKHNNPNPIVCSRCKDGFPDKEALDQHNELQPPCEVRDKASTEGVSPDDGMSAHVAHRLNSRREEDRIQTWDTLYHALFPAEQHIPSSEFEPPEETTCLKIRKHFQDAEPALRRRLADFAPNLRDVIMDAFRGHQEQVLTEFETSLQAKAGTKRSSSRAQLQPASREDLGASGKRPRRSHDHLSVAPRPQFLPLPQNQIVQHQAPDQDWINVHRASNPQPPPLDNPNAMYLPQQPGAIMNPMPASGAAYPPASGSQLADPTSFQINAGTYGELGSMGAWDTGSITNTARLVSPDMNEYQFSGNFYLLHGNQGMPSDNTAVDEDTGPYDDLGGPSHD